MAPSKKRSRNRAQSRDLYREKDQDHNHEHGGRHRGRNQCSGRKGHHKHHGRGQCEREGHHEREHYDGGNRQSPSHGSVSPRETPEVFQYQPLDSKVNTIRLLELEPINDQQMLSCRLTHMPCLNTPVYEALSYTWGSPDDPISTILLNGMPFTIRKNLYDALLALRKEHEPRVLWADAICIDQSKLDERKQQVQFMDSIYSRAATVLIWLGGANQLIQTTFKSGLASLTESDMRIYCSWVCGHDYWTRLWIIQELTLSQTLRICIGRHSEKWETFLESLSQYVERLLNSSSPNRRGCSELQAQIQVIKTLDQKRRGRWEDTSCLEKLLEDFQYAKCEKPIDKIYGLLGLAYDCEDGIIEADYTKSTFDLYVEVMGKFNRIRPASLGGRSTAYDRSMRIVFYSRLVSSILSPVCPPVDTGTRILAIAAVAGKILNLGPKHVEVYKTVKELKKWRSTHNTHYPDLTSHSKIRKICEAYERFLYKNVSWLSTKVFAIYPDKMYSRAKSPTPRRSTRSDTHQRDLSDTQSVSDFSWDSNEAHWLSKNLENIAAFHGYSDQRSSSHPVSWGTGRNRTPSRRSLLDTLFSPSPPTKRPSETVSSPCLFLGSNFLLGSVPANAKEGDIICQFWNTDVTALVRRRQGSSPYQVVGKVHLSTGYIEHGRAVFRERLQPQDGAKTIAIEMDLRTLSRLTC
ncbi:MAG: hypothetical protein M1813_007085 [Trichoglossum hirsutum]|nr:MAG: hypothetical protein M1813_007085 [Trichoglossum hirsutum]